ncbi:hypothetical protein M8C21_008222, partial [Ambrosia artemisiifolia]
NTYFCFGFSPPQERSDAATTTCSLASLKMDKDVGKRVEWLHSEKYSAAGDIFGHPQKTTRVGEEYQARIPSLMTENELSQLINVSSVYEFGLSIPVTWVNSQRKNKDESSVVGCETDGDLVPVPCSSSEEWSVIEHDSFILGLYIFGKNLRAVNKFMGDKGMPNVISYYYGKFYRSSEHQKWSMYRKKKRISKSLPGRKIFNGWRLQELLSRLFANVTDECKAIVDTSLAGLVKVRELTSLTVSQPVDNHTSASECGETEHNQTEESQNVDVNHNTAVNNPRPDTKLNLSRDEQPVRKPKVVFKLDPNTKMNLSRDEQPVRKLKLVFKRKTKRQIVDNIKNDNTSGEDEAMEDAACSEKKRTRIVIDLNNPRVGPSSDKDNKSYSAKPLVVSETTTKSNQTHDSLTLANGQRQSRRNRALTTKALEALENGFMNPKKKKREPEDVTRRRVHAKMGHVSSCGSRYVVDGGFDGSSHMVTESPK